MQPTPPKGISSHIEGKVLNSVCQSLHVLSTSKIEASRPSNFRIKTDYMYLCISVCIYIYICMCVKPKMILEGMISTQPED